MATLCVYIDKELRRKMRAAPDVNWSQVVRQAVEAKLLTLEPPKCCVCGTTEGLHKDGWYGHRCDSDECMVL